MKTKHGKKPLGAIFSAGALAVLLAALAGCEGDTGDTGPPGPPGDSADTPSDLDLDENSPGIDLAIAELSGGSGPNDTFQPGDRIAVTFTLKKNDGSAWKLEEMDGGNIMVSGPTFNYQRVIASQSDLRAASEMLDEGTYRYTFAQPIPETYLAPLNDTDSFGPADGEMTGEPLLNGTYTVGMYVSWNYTLGENSERDAGNATADFLIGGGSIFSAREVVGQDNCNACHKTLQAHGGSRRDVTLCLLCHTSGSEDRNVAEAAGGTPGVSIDFRVMIHRIHNGAHLPSVHGVTTRADGTRDYTAEKKPYEVVGFNNTVHDYSDIGFPVWPNLTLAMPRDAGYTALSTADKATEDAIRFGATDCLKCHGDPDADGPAAAPSQGDVAFAQPTRRACGSCHDDVVWEHKYTANMSTMPENTQDSACVLCHKVEGDALAVMNGHLHPVKNPALNPGVRFAIAEMADAGDGDGAVEVGEKIALALAVTDDAGTAVPATTATSVNVVVSGPLENRTLLLNTAIPTAMLTGTQPFRVNVPQPVVTEFVGRSTGAGAEAFTTDLAPHWNVTGATTTVSVRTGLAGPSELLAEPAKAPQNYVDLAAVTGFARDDTVVIDDGTPSEEYAKIALVDGMRLWLTTPLRFDHAAGFPVWEVTLASKTAFADYVLDPGTGTITEVTEFGDGAAVLVSYTSDFVMPAAYRPPFNDSPDLGESWAEWSGKPVIPGTYTVGLYGGRSVSVTVGGETTTYTAGAPAATMNFRVGTPGALDEYPFLTSGDNCNACHSDIYFHGGARRGFDTCILCHGISGAEDRPRYTAANAPETEGVSIDFRTMLHKIHHGKELAQGEDYVVVGFGASPYPNNFTPHTYSEVGFPPMPGGTQHCEKCHGEGNTAWMEPSIRSHPTAQGLPAREWRSACSSCHDSSAALAHMDTQTAPSGAEACATCHDMGADLPVDLMHKRP